MHELKKLRVCLSEDIPILTNRDPTYFYFLYDKLILFAGQNLYNDPFAIVEDVPEEPAHNLLYLTLNDGKIKVFVNYSIHDIAEIENEEQLDILKKTGTTYFMNANGRYLDLNHRIVSLPFNNGTYELTVNLANELIIDENTIIGFNPESNIFEIIGNKQDFDMVFTKGYKGKNSDTIDMNVVDHKIFGELKISPAYDNMLKIVSDGLYANASDRVTIQQFQSFVSSFQDYKTRMEYYLQDLIKKYDASQSVVSPQSISTRILKALEAVYPEINESLEKYNKIAAQFDGLEQRVKDYADREYAIAYSNLYKAIIDATIHPWESFDPEVPPEEIEEPEPFDPNNAPSSDENNDQTETEIPEESGDVENDEFNETTDPNEGNLDSGKTDQVGVQDTGTDDNIVRKDNELSSEKVENESDVKDDSENNESKEENSASENVSSDLDPETVNLEKSETDDNVEGSKNTKLENNSEDTFKESSEIV